MEPCPKDYVAFNDDIQEKPVSEITENRTEKKAEEELLHYSSNCCSSRTCMPTTKGEEEYTELMDEGLESIVEIYGPNTCVQIEDLHNRNGFRFVERYSKDYVVFNDDILEKLVSEIA